MTRYANDDEVTALVVLVSSLRPEWEPVARGYINGNSLILDVATLARRCIGAATDPSVKLPSDMQVWEPRVRDDADGTPGARPSDLPMEQVIGSPRCGHGAPLGQCALCRSRIAAEDPPRRGGRPRPADPSPYAAQVRTALHAPADAGE